MEEPKSLRIGFRVTYGTHDETEDVTRAFREVLDTDRTAIEALHPELVADTLNYGGDGSFTGEILVEEHRAIPYQEAVQGAEFVVTFNAANALGALLERIFWIPPESPRISGYFHFIFEYVQDADGNDLPVRWPTSITDALATLTLANGDVYPWFLVNIADAHYLVDVSENLNPPIVLEGILADLLAEAFTEEIRAALRESLGGTSETGANEPQLVYASRNVRFIDRLGSSKAGAFRGNLAKPSQGGVKPGLGAGGK